ncbi:MAG: DUF3662 domain-containing protein [Chloroflexota bacterium]
MTRSFAAVERFFERLLERPAARLFGAPIQPEQLQRQLERAMESGRVSRSDRTYVPNRFRVLVNPADAAVFDDDRTALQADLAEAVLRRARVRGYRLVARPEVSVIPAASVPQGGIEVVADPLDPGLVRSAAAGLRPVDLEGPKPPRAPIPGTAPVPQAADAVGRPPGGRGEPGLGHPAPAPVAPTPTPAPAPAPALAPLDVARPIPDRTTALIEIRSRNGQPWAFVFRGRVVRIGRGTENEMRAQG